VPYISPVALFLFFLALTVLLVFYLVWSGYSSRKGRRREEAPPERKPEVRPGVPGEAEEKVAVEVKPEEAVKDVLIRRIEGIKNRDARAIAALVDRERYTKFDDWPPFERQDQDVLKREAEALKVLREYSYETIDWKVHVLGDTALASFIINYRGTIRDLKFDIRSRVTALLAKQEGAWRLVHEHWSRFPQKAQGPRNEWWKKSPES